MKLDLGFRSGLTGDMSALAPLTALTYLYLDNTAVAGDISGLAPLTALTILNLERTSVAGDLSGLAPLTALTYLSLPSTKVTGAVNGLDPLTKLTELYLDYTAVTGCGAFCTAHPDITSHQCPKAPLPPSPPTPPPTPTPMQALLAFEVRLPKRPNPLHAHPLSACRRRLGTAQLRQLTGIGVLPQASGNGNGLDSWKAGTDPCGSPDWVGVTCCGGGAVEQLDLDAFSGAPLVGLTGDISALAPLTALTLLDLDSTAVAGDISALAPLTALTVLDLDNTKVTGAANSLDPLTKLTALYLDGTAVTGCGAFCTAHPAIDNACKCHQAPPPTPTPTPTPTPSSTQALLAFKVCPPERASPHKPASCPPGHCTAPVTEGHWRVFAGLGQRQRAQRDVDCREQPLRQPGLGRRDVRRRRGRRAACHAW